MRLQTAFLLPLVSWQCHAHAINGLQPQDPLNSHSSSCPVLKDNLIAWHKNLTSIDSVTYNEQEAGDWLVHSLRSQGYTVEKQYVDEDAGRFNVYAYPGSTRDTRLLLSGHYDTVPPFLEYSHNGSTIFGRGSVDDKASLAAQLVAVNELISSNEISKEDVSLLFVVGEETGGDGMRKANDLNLKPDVIVFGEPTEGKLVSGHKGNLILLITAKGKAAHSGYPWLGRSANEVLTRALAALIELAPNLPSSDKYGVTTINLGRIEGGVAANVVAESASANIAIRIAASSPAEIKTQLTKAIGLAMESFLDENTSVEDVIDLEFPNPGYGPVDIDHDVPGFEVMTVNYGTDIPNLEGREGQKRYLYGPGSIMVAHSANEELEEGELEGAVEGYERIVLFALEQLEKKGEEGGHGGL